LLFIGQGDLLGLPVPLWIMVAAMLIGGFVLTQTAFGRRVYAMGGNEQATFLSGINVKRHKVLVYVISGICAAIVGVILVARFNSAQADTGLGSEMDAVAAAVIGGTSLAGGTGSILGAVIGGAIMGVIRNGLVLMKISAYWQQAIIGVVIVLAAVLDRVKNK
jgi:ribose transport system permease protein